MTALSVAAGALTVLAVGVDVVFTVLHPTRRGPLAYAANRSVWLAIKALVPRRRLPTALHAAGPGAMIANLAVWVGLLWLGYALVYLPYAGGLQASAGLDLDGRGLLEALYLSGAALTTVGFGDLVAHSDALRLVTVLEAGSGLAVITAAIAYLLSVYSTVSEVRGTTARFAHMRADLPEGAAAVVLHGGVGEVRDLQRELIANHQHLRRFPVLYYFQAEREESLLTLLEAAANVVLVLRWGVRADALPWARDYGEGLERTFARVLEDLKRDFIGGRGGPVAALEPGEIDAADARRRRARLRAAVEHVEAGAAAPGDGEPPAELRRFVAGAEEVLGRLAGAHAQHHEPLLHDGPARPAAADA